MMRYCILLGACYKHVNKTILKHSLGEDVCRTIYSAKSCVMIRSFFLVSFDGEHFAIF